MRPLTYVRSPGFTLCPFVRSLQNDDSVLAGKSLPLPHSATRSRRWRWRSDDDFVFEKLFRFFFEFSKSLISQKFLACRQPKIQLQQMALVTFTRFVCSFFLHFLRFVSVMPVLFHGFLRCGDEIRTCRNTLTYKTCFSLFLEEKNAF